MTKSIYRAPFFSGRLGGNGFERAYKCYKCCKEKGINQDVPWPVNPNTIVTNPKNIYFEPSDIHIFQTPGCYFQGFGKIVFGKNVFVGPNVGFITANHDFSDLSMHQQPKEIRIGDCCWIGMNSVILPGVVLGARTIVGAGSVVTKSFLDGNCVIGGNPAKIIRKIS